MLILNSNNNITVIDGRKWFCSDECALGSEGDDPVQAYAQDLLWSGLKLMCRRDVVRSGNGSLLSMYWKMDMVESYWKRGHCHYLKIAHKFIAGNIFLNYFFRFANYVILM